MTVTTTDVSLAQQTISDHTRSTPVFKVRGHELGIDCDIWFKLEYLQISGTFKGRGATNFIRTSSFGEAGVVAASGGNHGAAIAYAARAAGVPANIFVPTISAPAKVAKLRSYGATVHQVGAVFAEAFGSAVKFLDLNDGLMAHPYNDELVIAGAGTVALEFERQVGPLDQIIVACGGGGLAAGVAAWCGDRTTVICCETSGTAGYAAAVDAGRPVPVEISGVAGDALGATSIGEIPWRILSSVETASVVVSDEAALQAKEFLWSNFNIVAEPSACVPLAAILTKAWVPKGDVGLVICGANTELAS
jgi:threonine dehydratase